MDMWERKVFVSELLIMEKSRRLLSIVNEQLNEDNRIELSLSDGWLHRFKLRNGFKSFLTPWGRWRR